MVHAILFNRKNKKGEDGKLTESLLTYFSEDVKQFLLAEEPRRV